MSTELNPTITHDLLKEAMTYEQYRDLIDQLLLEHKTTGADHSDGLVKYTELNRQRMRKWDKIVDVNESLLQRLRAIEKPMVWLVLTEAWCGDAAQNIPVLARMAEATPQVSLKLLLRDSHLDLMDHYLTQGSRSIPKLIVLDATTLKELGTWGPRPAETQKMVMAHKENPGNVTKEEFYEQIHAWYAHDKTQSIQHEFEELLDRWEA